MTVEIGGGDEKIERMAGWQQRRGMSARFRPGGSHRIERFGEEVREADPAKGRGEPACADEVGELEAHFPARAGRGNRAADDIAGTLEQEPHQRLCPELGKPAPRPRIGIEQYLDIGPLQPERGEGFEALPTGKGLRE